MNFSKPNPDALGLIAGPTSDDRGAIRIPALHSMKEYHDLRLTGTFVDLYITAGSSKDLLLSGSSHVAY